MEDWLEQTRELQTQAYGKDPHVLEGDDLAEFIRWNVLGATDELHEMLAETRWKPWATRKEGEPIISDKKAYIKEAVDILHFVANLLVAGQVTDQEFWDAYRAKMEVNRERQARAGGYESRRGVDKCVQCGRSFDDVGRYSVTVDTELCTVCGYLKHSSGVVK